MKKLWKNLLGAAAGAAAVLLGYSIYVFAAYDRLEDRLPLTVENARAAEAETERVYTAVSYNLGFGAYSADYSFFMDGGTESRAYSAEAVRENIGGAMDAASKLEPDFLLLQEVDRDATRSYHVDEVSMAAELMPEKTWVYAQNYDSPYLFWPVTEPHGASKSGIVTMSAYRVDSALRRSLPVAENVSCILDLDRCYSVSRIPVENGKTLCLYNAHLSAYLSDGQIAMEQLELLLSDMAAEYEAGNYVVCGGDFNKDLLGDSAARFGVPEGKANWSAPFPVEMLPEGITLQAPFRETRPVPSCRNAYVPYDPETSLVLTVDGFLVSDNVRVERADVVDTGFAWSDHNPVVLSFFLEGTAGQD